jgi:hypothetical protein
MTRNGVKGKFLKKKKKEKEMMGGDKKRIKMWAQFIQKYRREQQRKARRNTRVGEISLGCF